MLFVFVAVLVSTGTLYQGAKGLHSGSRLGLHLREQRSRAGHIVLQNVRLPDEVSRILIKDPDVDSFMFSVGSSNWGSSGSNQSRMHVELMPRGDRELSASEVAQKLRPQLTRFPGVRGLVQVPQTIRVGGHGSRTAYDFTLQGPDTQELTGRRRSLSGCLRSCPRYRM